MLLGMPSLYNDLDRIGITYAQVHITERSCMLSWNHHQMTQCNWPQNHERDMRSIEVFVFVYLWLPHNMQVHVTERS